MNDTIIIHTNPRTFITLPDDAPVYFPTGAADFADFDADDNDSDEGLVL